MTTATLAPGLTFEPEGHVYRFNGERVPSVTQVLDRELIDYSMVPNHILDFAAARGTAVHKAAELFDEDNLDEESVDERIRPYLSAWLDFRQQSGFVIEHSEQRMYSARHRFAGTVDRIGMLGRRRAVVEIKTTAKLHPATAVQCSAYLRAFNESRPRPEQAAGVCSVWLRANGTYRFDEHDPLDHWSMFLALLNPDDPNSAETREGWEAKFL